MGIKAILFLACCLFVFRHSGKIDVSSTYQHHRMVSRFGYRSPPMQSFFPLFPKFYLSNPVLTKPPPPAPAPIPDVDQIVRFKLYTRQNKYSPEEIHVDRKRTQASSYYKVNRKTKILIHGFVDSTTDSSAGEWMNFMRDAYLNAEDVNVIVVDYSFIALLIFYWTNLPQMSSTRIAELVYFLNNSGSPYDSFHLIGRSWGAHVAGMAGHTLSGKLGRITGLDPVNPPFRFIGFQYRLDKTDAKFVDVYHLNGRNRFNLLDIIGVTHRYDGLSSPMGHVDIYPNHKIREGTGCAVPNANQYTASCRLGVGAAVFTETIRRSDAFSICPCETFLKYLRGDCRCDMRNSFEMGEHISHSCSGVYQISESYMQRPAQPKPKPTESVPVLTPTTSASTTTSKPSEDIPSEDSMSSTSTVRPSAEESSTSESSTSTAIASLPESSTTEPTTTPTTVSNVPESIPNEPETSSTVSVPSVSESIANQEESVTVTSTTIAASVSGEVVTSESTAASLSTEPTTPESSTSETTSSTAAQEDEANAIPDNVSSQVSSTEGALASPAPEGVPAIETESSTSTSTTTTSPESVPDTETSELPFSSPLAEDRQPGISLSEDGQSASSSALGRQGRG